MDKPVILLVDDEKDLGWILRNIFREAGHSLIFASTLKEGLRKFKKSKRLDAAIIDLMLGKESGLAFVRKVRTINAKVPLIMISALSDADIKDEAGRLGVSCFLDKPLKPERLLEIFNSEGSHAREFSND